MIIKGQLLSATNLNNAYISKTDTNAQSINSTLTISGGALTLKNSIITDNAGSGYMRIDPQGNNVIIYDGVNNQRLDVYSSSGSESTYITTVNGTKSIGMLDVSSAIDHLEINTNSGKYIKTGGDIYLSKNTPTINFLNSAGAGSITGQIEMSENGNFWVNAQGSKILWLNWLSPTNPSSFSDVMIGNGNSGSSILTVKGSSNSVGINQQSPSYPLDVNGTINIEGSNSLLFGTYGGGFNMTDTTWIRTTGNKSFYHNSGEFRTDGSLEVGNAGATFKVDNGGNLSYSGGRFSVTTAGLTTINGSLVLNTSQTQGSGIKMDGTTIDTVGGGGNIAIANLNQLRFGSNSQWDYNQWAGVKYDSPNKILYIGGPASSHFSANASPSQIATVFDGLSGMGINMTPRSGVILDSSGDIGIASGHSLWVGNNATSGNFTRIHNNGIDAYIDFGTNLHMRNNGASDNLFISSNGYVGVGTTNPLRKLDIAGDIRFSGNIYGGTGGGNFLTDAGGALPIKAGSLAITSSYSNNAPANGLYVQGAVGIGTTSPTSMFQVNESAMQMYTVSDHLYLQKVGGTQYPYIGFVDSGGTRGGYIGWGTLGSHLDFALENNNNLYINLSNGTNKVGIGTANPSATLDVVGNVQTNQTFVSNSTSADVFQAMGASGTKTFRWEGGNLRFYTGQNSLGEVVTFASNGNVGLKNASPSYQLDVTGDIRTTTAFRATTNNAQSLYVGSNSAIWDVNTANTMGIYGQQNTAVGGLKLGSTGPTLYGSGGYLGIGTTSPAYTLDVNGNIRLFANNAIYSGYNNNYILRDHNNGNVTVNGAGGNLYLGYINTGQVWLSAPMYTNSGADLVVDTAGKLYYQGNDTDTRYVNRNGDTITGNTTFSGTLTASGTLNYKGQDVDSRYLLASNGTASGTTTFSNLTINGNMQINNSGSISGIGSLNGVNGLIARSVDSWLRINDTGGHTSGVYFGSSIVRTDGQFQVGGNGSSFLVDTSGNTTMTGQLKINKSATHIQLQESGNNTWHIESVNNNLQVVRTGVAVNAIFHNSGYMSLENYLPGYIGWHLQLALNAGADCAIWHPSSDMAMGFHSNGSVYWMTNASTSSGAYVMQLDTTTNKLWVGGNELMQKNKNVSFGTSNPTGGSSGDIYIQI